FQTASYTIDEAAIGTSAVEKLTLTGGAFESAAEIKLSATTKLGNNGFGARGDTAGINGTLTLKSGSLNNDVAISVDIKRDDTAETAATKINSKLNATAGGNGGISATV